MPTPTNNELTYERMKVVNDRLTKIEKHLERNNCAGFVRKPYKLDGY